MKLGQLYYNHGRVAQPANWLVSRTGTVTVMAQAVILTILGKEAGNSFDKYSIETGQKGENNVTGTDAVTRDSSTTSTKGTRVGIGVSAAILVISVVFVIALVWKRRQRTKEESTTTWLEKPELKANDVPRH